MPAPLRFCRVATGHWPRLSQARKYDRDFFPQPRDLFMNDPSFVIAPPKQPSIAVAGDSRSFPVRRIWCVGRNYLEHIREMGNDERALPFFFAKHADMIE